MPYRETLDLLLERFKGYDYFGEEDTHLLSTFLHPDLLPLLTDIDLDLESSELICHICDLYDMPHPQLSEARIFIEKEKERRANYVSPMDRLMAMQQSGQFSYLDDNFVEKEEAQSSMKAQQAKKKKDANRAKSKAKKKAQKKQRKK